MLPPSRSSKPSISELPSASPLNVFAWKKQRESEWMALLIVLKSQRTIWVCRHLCLTSWRLCRGCKTSPNSCLYSERCFRIRFPWKPKEKWTNFAAYSFYCKRCGSRFFPYVGKLLFPSSFGNMTSAVKGATTCYCMITKPRYYSAAFTFGVWQWCAPAVCCGRLSHRACSSGTPSAAHSARTQAAHRCRHSTSFT